MRAFYPTNLHIIIIIIHARLRVLRIVAIARMLMLLDGQKYTHIVHNKTTVCLQRRRR